MKATSTSDSDWEVRRAAVLALPKLGEGGAVVAALKDEAWSKFAWYQYAINITLDDSISYQ